jgi:hypothetical protein
VDCLRRVLKENGPTILLFLVSGAGCSIPERTNPFDPTNAPAAALSVAPLSGPARTVFHIDASDSSGGLGPRSFRFDLDGDPAGVFEIDAAAAVLDSALTPASLSFGGSGAGSVERTIRVEVSSAGATSIASVTVLVTNEAPVLDPGPERIVAPWVSRRVVLDPCGGISPCPSYDPDGSEGVTWAWRSVVAPAGVVLTNSSNGTASFDSPTEPQVLVFELTGDDGFAARRQLLGVRVAREGWMTTAEPARTLRLDAERLFLPLTGLPRGGAVDPVTGDLVLAYVDGTFSGRRYRADGTLAGIWPLPPAGLEAVHRWDVAWSADHGCLRGFDYTTSTHRVFVMPPLVSGSMEIGASDAAE